MHPETVQTPTSSQIWLRRVAVLALVLAAGVIILGAWTRLSDAGLGCPDWPGCYGHLDVRKAIEHVNEQNASNPGPCARPTRPSRRWCTATSPPPWAC